MVVVCGMYRPSVTGRWHGASIFKVNQFYTCHACYFVFYFSFSIFSLNLKLMFESTESNDMELSEMK